jgi:hypothetical protein
MRLAATALVLLMLGAVVGCAKDYPLAAADGGPDDTIAIMPGDDAPVDQAQQPDVVAPDSPGAPDAELDGGHDAIADHSTSSDAATETHQDAPSDNHAAEVHPDATAEDLEIDQVVPETHPDTSVADVEPSDAQRDAASDAAFAPIVLSIPTIRDPSAADHPTSGTLVQTSGIVSAVKTAGTTHTFFMQAANVAKYAGVYVYVGSANVTNLGPGAIVEVVGIISNYRGIDQIDTTSGSFQITGVTTTPAPLEVAPADIATGGTLSVELQSMLVHLDSTVLATTTTAGTDFKVSPGNLIITSFVANGTGISPFPSTVGQSFSSLTGVVYVFGSGAVPDYKLAPRALTDIVSP